MTQILLTLSPMQKKIVQYAVSVCRCIFGIGSSYLHLHLLIYIVHANICCQARFDVHCLVFPLSAHCISLVPCKQLCFKADRFTTDNWCNGLVSRSHPIRSELPIFGLCLPVLCALNSQWTDCGQSVACHLKHETG